MPNHYGDPTTTPDAYAAFLPQLAAALTIATRQTWTVNPKPDERSRYHASLLNGKYKLHCHLWRDRGQGKTDRIQITGSLDGQLCGYTRASVDSKANLSIACTLSRGAQTIAADINTRLWETYQPVYDRAEAAYLAHEARQDSRQQTAEHLSRIVDPGHIVSTDWRRHAYNGGSPHFSWGFSRKLCHCQGTVEVERDGRIKLKLEELSARDAAFILQFLAGNS